MLSTAAIARTLAAALALLAANANANDRPYQSARTAVMEQDDEGTWSFESWTQRYGSVRGLSFEPEYSFTSRTSVQGELTRLVDRNGSDTGREAEIEFKHLFNDVHRDGWGWGVSAAFGAERTRAAGTQRSVGLRLPVSIALGDTGALVHVNAGWGKVSDERGRFTPAIAAEASLTSRVRGFAELARDVEGSFGQAGVRWWVKREKLAIDFALQQHRANGERASGFILGLGWYDF